MTQDQRIILEDAISCCDCIKDTFKMIHREDREREQYELVERVKSDIRTVLRLERV